MSSLIAIPLLLGCVSRAPVEPVRVSFLVATLPDGDSVEAWAPLGIRYTNAWAHSVQSRPALASLFTGLSPDEHGLTDPVLHDLAGSTFAEELADAGWSTAYLGDRPSEDRWGFASENRITGEHTITWMSGDQGIADWLAENPNGYAFLTNLPLPRDIREGGGGVDLVQIGPRVPIGVFDDALVGQSAIADAIRRLAESPLDTDSQLLASDVVLVDALPRLTSGGPVRKVTRTPGGVEIGEIALPSLLDRVVPTGSALPTDPLGTQQLGPTGAIDSLRAAQRALQGGRLRYAEGHLERAEHRAGRTVAGDLLRAEVLDLQARSDEAIDLLIDRYGRSPSDSMAFRVAAALLEHRRAAEAGPWFEIVLRSRPDHLGALIGRLRSAQQSAADPIREELLARLWTAAPELAAREEIRIALDAGYPIDTDWMRQSQGSDPDMQLLRARAIWATGHWVEALDQADSILVDHPRDIAVRLTLATWLLELGEPGQAVRLVGPVARRYPEDLRVSTLNKLAHDALASDRVQLQGLRSVWRGHR